MISVVELAPLNEETRPSGRRVVWALPLPSCDHPALFFSQHVGQSRISKFAAIRMRSQSLTISSRAQIVNIRNIECPSPAVARGHLRPPACSIDDLFPPTLRLVLNNPAKFTDPYRINIEFESIAELQDGASLACPCLAGCSSQRGRCAHLRINCETNADYRPSDLSCCKTSSGV